MVSRLARTDERRAKGDKMSGKALRAIRVARGLTQAQLADIFNRAPSYIAQVERGERAPSLELACIIALWTGGLLPAADWAQDEVDDFLNRQEQRLETAAACR